jgi:hypothetical protein
MNTTTLTTTTLEPDANKTLPSYVGFIFLFGSSVFYGSNFLPVKQVYKKISSYTNCLFAIFGKQMKIFIYKTSMIPEMECSFSLYFASLFGQEGLLLIGREIFLAFILYQCLADFYGAREILTQFQSYVQ